MLLLLHDTRKRGLDTRYSTSQRDGMGSGLTQAGSPPLSSSHYARHSIELTQSCWIARAAS